MSKAQNLGKLATNLPESGIVPIIGGGTGAATVAAALTALGAGGAALKISGIAVTDSNYTVLDDTAVDIAGGYIKITGTGFASGCQVVVNQTLATSATYISATEVRAQLPATTAGTYIVYVINSDGGVAIRVNGVSFSALPAWTTTSTLPDTSADTSINIQLAATSATTYTLAAGSTLPSGLTLSSTGLLSGAVAGTNETTYNFTVSAIDAEAQDSPKTFSITITVGEPYFRNTVLLLTGDGVNAGTNNTFLDSSTNNFTVTRTGTPTQGSISPFSPTGWSGYFNGTTDYLTLPTSTILPTTGNFTVEAWVYPTSTNDSGVFYLQGGAEYAGFRVGYTGYFYLLHSQNGTTWAVNSGNTGSQPINQWYHIAVTRNGNTGVMYLNGQSIYTFTWGTLASGTINLIGAYRNLTFYPFTGYISNTRIVSGTAVYTTAFTPSITPLTAVANTSLLTLQSNRFKDNSTNALTITSAGTPSIQALSPFAPTATYSTSIHGGSLYFNGSTDKLTTATSPSLNMGSGDFTVECWLYWNGSSLSYQNFIGSNSTGFTGNSTFFRVWGSGGGTGLFWTKIGIGNPTHDGVSSVYSTNSLPVNTWTHVAATRSSGIIKLFMNGNLEKTGSTDTSTYDFGDNGLCIGTSPWDGANGWYGGYISNARIIKGTAVYTAAFTPPTAPVTAIANTSLLLNGTNAVIYDATGKSNLTTVGDAKISTSIKKYGTGSLSFDGAGDYLSIPNNIAFNFGTGDFTVELWFNLSTVAASSYTFVSNYSGTAGWEVQYRGDVGNKFRFGYGDASLLDSSAQSLIVGTWYHLAVSRNGTNLKIFLNGVQIASTTNSTSITSTAALWVGGLTGLGQYMPGYIDDLRITKGVARYTANFTPPASAHALK